MLLQDVTYETGKVDSWKLKGKKCHEQQSRWSCKVLWQEKISCLGTITFWH